MLTATRTIQHQVVKCRHWSSATQRSNLDYTFNRYKVNRGRYTKITDQHKTFFNSLLGSTRVISEPDECESYNIDWLKTVRGDSRVVLKPNSTDEVSEILKYCNAEKLAVCPQSGNTGLTGGSVPVFDEVVISMKLMNEVIKIDELSGVLVCQSGCVLESLENSLNNVGLMMPLDLGAKGSCLIGGNVSTNAGGIRLLRYGNLHGNILGLEAVLANGEVVDCLNTLKKDNTGYHLKHLFIGSEGTLGIVTKVAVQCLVVPKATNIIFVGTKDFNSVLSVYSLAKQLLGEILSSCELIDSISLECSTNVLGLRNPLGSRHEFYVLIETGGSNQEHDEQKVNNFLEKLMEDGLVQDGTVTSEPSKIQNIWAVRERLAEALIRDAYLFKYDISLPLTHFYKIVEVLREHLADADINHITGFGHLGDGNIHIQVSCKEYSPDIEKKLVPFIFEYTSKLGGSISAEHGIGFKNAKYLHYSKDKSAIQLMKQLKQMMDPNAILNPYKVLHPI